MTFLKERMPDTDASSSPMNNGIHPTRKIARTIRPLIVRILTRHPLQLSAHCSPEGIYDPSALSRHVKATHPSQWFVGATFKGFDFGPRLKGRVCSVVDRSRQVSALPPRLSSRPNEFYHQCPGWLTLILWTSPTIPFDFPADPEGQDTAHHPLKMPVMHAVVPARRPSETLLPC